MKIPKNCQHCNSYTPNWCKKLKKHVGNVQSCRWWSLHMKFFKCPEKIELVPYDDYEIEEVKNGDNGH